MDYIHALHLQLSIDVNREKHGCDIYEEYVLHQNKDTNEYFICLSLPCGESEALLEK